MIYKIPLTPNPQTFSISLNAIPYRMTVQWCEPAAAWMLSLADGAGNPLFYNAPLVTGCDLLEQFRHLAIGGGNCKLIAQTESDLNAVPTFQNLGIEGNLYFTVPN